MSVEIADTRMKASATDASEQYRHARGPRAAPAVFSSRLGEDPLDPPRVAADPMGVLAALDPDKLDCGPRLVKAMWDRRLRQTIVPDYP